MLRSNLYLLLNLAPAEDGRSNFFDFLLYLDDGIRYIFLLLVVLILFASFDHASILPFAFFNRCGEDGNTGAADLSNINCD